MSETTQQPEPGRVNAEVGPAVPPSAKPGPAARGHRKEREGEVVSAKMTKTIVVRVQRRFPHPKFKKVITAYKKFYVHAEKNEAKPGDRVRIVETRPLSKLKRWRLVGIVDRAVVLDKAAA